MAPSDGYHWSNWDWDSIKNREGRWRINSKGKYVFQYRDSQSQEETTPRNDEDLSPSRLVPMVSSSTTGGSQYYGNHEYNFQSSSRTSGAVEQLSENFAQTSLSETSGFSQYPPSNISPFIVTSMGSGTSNFPATEPIAIPESSWRSNPTANEFVPLNSGGNWTNASGGCISDTNMMSFSHHPSSEYYELPRRQDDEGYYHGQNSVSSSLATVVPVGWCSSAEQSSMNISHNSLGRSHLENVYPAPFTGGFHDPIETTGDTFQRSLTGEPGDHQLALDIQPISTPNSSGSGDNTPQAPKEIHRNIVTLKTKKSKEKLDPNYQVHRSKCFTPGQVFKVLWSEPEGNTARPGGTDVTEFQLDAKYKGQNVYSSIRRFVIVAADDGHCQCLPILTYGGRATLKGGVKPDDHAIIYMGRKAPEPLERESLSLRSIKVDPKTPRDKLEPESRINYAKIYTVEHNVKVLFIGKIAESSVARLMTDFDMVWDRKRKMY